MSYIFKWYKYSTWFVLYLYHCLQRGTTCMDVLKVQVLNLFISSFGTHRFDSVQTTAPHWRPSPALLDMTGVRKALPVFAKTIHSLSGSQNSGWDWKVLQSRLEVPLDPLTGGIICGFLYLLVVQKQTSLWYRGSTVQYSSKTLRRMLMSAGAVARSSRHLDTGLYVYTLIVCKLIQFTK